MYNKNMIDVNIIINELKKINMLDEYTLIMIKDNDIKYIYNYKGVSTYSPVFKNIIEPLAVFTSSKYSKIYSEKGLSIKASTDDAAQMFGAKLKCVLKEPYESSLVRDNGFLATGRFLSELIASAILIDKMCKIELFGPKLGPVKHLFGPLCFLEHLVYKYSYSLKAMEESHE